MRAIVIGLVILVVAVASTEPVTIVADGEPRAAIVLPADPPDQLTRAAKEMNECIREACGVGLPTANEPSADLGAIHIGETSYVRGLDIDLGDLGGDGYVIRFPAPGTVVILGPTADGTEFGVYGFLERFVGVRWLLPTDVGRDVPAADTITVPDEPVRDEPVFMSRLYSGSRGGAQVEWARRSGMHGTISFHHNLRNLYGPDVFAKEHPEFYPLVDGERFDPLESDRRWQPCFTAPGIVEAGARRIIEYFNEHPEARSYSLGVNDTRMHCECESCRALDSGRDNFLGIPHLSDRYFTWANAVVERVLEVHPEKYFGCLAYNNVVEPPDRVEVHPRIVPYMTYDRMKWIDPDIERHGKELTEQWHAKCPRLGWYDYMYGTPYCLPRFYPHKQADYLRWGYEHGVRALYGEAYPNFGEGPKLYIWLSLAWDPYVDVYKLLDEWYERCVGAKAAPALKAYYRHWEDFWTRRVLDSAWFTERGQYLPFSRPGYLAQVSPHEIAQSRKWLEEVVAKAETEKQRARANLLLEAFEYYEASALAYPRAEDTEPLPDTEQEALGGIEASLEALAMAERRMRLAEGYSEHPVLRHPLPPTRYGALHSDGWGANRLWGLFEWVQKSERIRERLGELAESSEHKTVREHARLMLRVAEGSAESIAPNPSFEEGDGFADGWSTWVKWGIGSMYRSQEYSHAGEYSVCCEGMKRGGPHAGLKLEPGKYAVTAFVYAPEGQEHEGTVEVRLTPRDPEGSNLRGGPSSTIVPGAGRWQPIAAADDIPGEVDGKTVASVLLVVIVDGFEADDKVCIDDVRVFRLD